MNLCKQNNEREALQELFDHAFRSEEYSSLRSYYTMLRKLQLNRNKEVIIQTVDISSLAENLTLSFDALTESCNKSFVYCGNSTSFILANQKELIFSILTLFSNAFLYGNSNLITVKTYEHNENVYVEVQNGGHFLSDSQGIGISYVNNTIKKYDGQFLICSEKYTVRSIMVFRKTNKGQSVSVPQFYDLLNDRLSPVYVEFFGMQ